MDLAVYISELLGLQDEVNLPGIGNFAQVRINGYFNEKENRLYPPTHRINFDPEFKNDEDLARYISNKKNISLASSKYFIEKYVNGLKQQIVIGKVDIDGIGQLYLDGSVIGFIENSQAKNNDPAFFGFKPVNIISPSEKPVIKFTPPPVVPNEEKPITPPPVQELVSTELINDRIPPPPVQEQVATEFFNERIPPPPPKPTVIEETEVQEEPEYEYEEPAPRNNRWIILLLIVIIALLALMGLYKYKAEWFDHSSKDTSQTFVAVDTSKHSEKKTIGDDSTKKVTSTQDSAAKAAALVTRAVDTDATLHYELQAGAFKAKEQADAVLQKFQGIGLQPRILKHTKGNSYKITLGTYFDKELAQKAEDSILNVTKMKKEEIFLQTYKPKR